MSFFSLHKIILVNVLKPLNIKNSFKLIDKLSIFYWWQYSLISLDIISLFTYFYINISIDSALDSISKRWRFISEECNILKDEFLKTVSLILNLNYFTFGNWIYKQTFGTPVSSPLSPIVAFSSERLEGESFWGVWSPVPFYFRYVDFIALANPSYLIINVLNFQLFPPDYN